MKRRHVLMMVSVVMLSFLVGTLFSTSFARDGDQNPINEILEIVSRLESKVDACVDEVSAALDYLDYKLHEMNVSSRMYFDILDAGINSIEDKLGQGLVGEWEHGSVYTERVWNPLISEPGLSPVDVWNYTAPDGNPKKVSFYVDLREMENDDSIHFVVLYMIEPGVETGVGSLSQGFSHWQDSVRAELILDQVPVATSVKIELWHFATATGTEEEIDWEPITIYWQAVIEEL